MTNDGLEAAQEGLTALLSVLNVEQVIFVDDFFEEDLNHETVIGWLSEIEEDVPVQVVEKLGEFDFDNSGVWKRQFIDHWGKLSNNEKKELALFVSEALKKSLKDDRRIDEHLSNLFGKKILMYSPTKWETAKDKLFKKATREKKIFCIFDQDLSLSEGYTAQGSRSGAGLIKEVKENLQDACICCLLSHTIPSIEYEIRNWKKLSADNSLALRDFLPLAKSRLAGDQSPSLLVDGIKKAALNQYFEDLKKITASVIEDSHTRAVNQFQEIDPYDFDLMILVASYEEGIWEAESLLRIYQIFHKDEILKSFLNKKNLEAVNKNVLDARRISSVKIDGVVNNFPQVRPIRRKELYQLASSISYSPLDVGDIFRVGNQNKWFILLGQPCDLMIRSDGNRKNKFVNLVKVSRKEKSDLEKWKAKYPDRLPGYLKMHAELSCFFDNTKYLAIVSFDEILTVSMDMLDLAVLNENGKCEINANEDLEIPTHLTQGWYQRLSSIVNEYKMLHNRLSEYSKGIKAVDEAIRDSIWKSLMPKVALENSVLPEIPYENGTFDFKLVRVARYRQPGASNLLKLYTAYLSRDADDVDFLKFI